MQRALKEGFRKDSMLMALRCYQIILNIAGSGLSLLVIEVTVGMLAIIPTLNTVVCIECRDDGYLTSF